MFRVQSASRVQMPFGRSRVQGFKGSKVQRFKGFAVQMPFGRSRVQRFKGSRVQGSWFKAQGTEHRAQSKKNPPPIAIGAAIAGLHSEIIMTSFVFKPQRNQQNRAVGK